MCYLHGTSETKSWRIVNAHFVETKGINMSRIAILFAGALAIVPLSGAQAQTINAQAIVGACSGAATACEVVVRTQIAALRRARVAGTLTQLQLNAALGQIAATVQTVSVGSTPAAREVLADVLRDVAAEVSDPVQAAAIVQAAVQVEVAGPTITIPAPILAPVASSPT